MRVPGTVPLTGSRCHWETPSMAARKQGGQGGARMPPLASGNTPRACVCVGHVQTSRTKVSLKSCPPLAPPPKM